MGLTHNFHVKKEKKKKGGGGLKFLQSEKGGGCLKTFCDNFFFLHQPPQQVFVNGP